MDSHFSEFFIFNVFLKFVWFDPQDLAYVSRHISLKFSQRDNVTEILQSIVVFLAIETNNFQLCYWRKINHFRICLFFYFSL